MKKSAARNLLEHVWHNANDKSAFSWERLNHSMHAALTLAIGSGMEFTKQDWGLAGFNAGRWVGETMEVYYRMAVIVGNRSAIESYEAWIGRKPIIADDVNMQGRYHYNSERGYTHGTTGRRQRERLVIGCQFSYRGETVEVTSFTKDGAAVCCSFKSREKDSRGYEKGPKKVLHRYVVTPELVQAERAEKKEKLKAVGG